MNPMPASVFGQDLVAEADSQHGGESRAGLMEDGVVDATNLNADTLRLLLQTNRPLRFDWENRWLSGDQYAHMLNNIDVYQEYFNMPKLAEKQHPENIYLEPQSK